MHDREKEGKEVKECEMKNRTYWNVLTDKRLKSESKLMKVCDD